MDILTIIIGFAGAVIGYIAKVATTSIKAKKDVQLSDNEFSLNNAQNTLDIIRYIGGVEAKFRQEINVQIDALRKEYNEEKEHHDKERANRMKLEDEIAKLKNLMLLKDHEIADLKRKIAELNFRLKMREENVTEEDDV